MRSLRQQLFRSHLLVMFVALGVMIAGTVILFSLLVLVGEIDFGRGGPRVDHADDGPGGILVLLLPLGAAGAAAAFVSWMVARRLAEPIEATRAATHQLAAGRYDVEVNGGTVTELADLAADVNHLGAELRATEQRRLRLVGDVAHELRNPLATIEASMEALMDGVVPANDETFARVAREAARLRRLAGDLSELSATAEPSAVRATETVDLVDVVDHVVAQLTPQASAKGLVLQWVRPEAMTAIGDRDRLTQVFTNIVGNAVQYTDHGEVAVAVTPVDGADRQREWIQVTVTDTGPGLAADDLTLVFERFHRVNHNSEGTGVGLAVAKSLVESHGGTVVATSPGLRQGAVFTVTLPAR